MSLQTMYVKKMLAQAVLGCLGLTREGLSGELQILNNRGGGRSEAEIQQFVGGG